MIGKIIKTEENRDARGILKAVDSIPFAAKRVFFISDVPEDAVRGNHFSKTSRFLYFAVQGGCKVELDDGMHKETYDLSGNEALLFDKNTWMKAYDFQKDTILCVMADQAYQSSDYAADYRELQKIAREKDV